MVADVPDAGFTGSLAYRFDRGDPAGLGRVRAKTGTLTGVHGLTGTLTTIDGAVMTFVAIADRVRRRTTSRPGPGGPDLGRARRLHVCCPP